MFAHSSEKQEGMIMAQQRISQLIAQHHISTAAVQPLHTPGYILNRQALELSMLQL